jgi:hypothetical protein
MALTPSYPGGVIRVLGFSDPASNCASYGPALQPPGDELAYGPRISRARSQRERTRSGGSRDDVEPEFSARAPESNGAGSARNRERRLELLRREVNHIGRQLCDTVRGDRTDEVDRLTTGALELELGRPSFWLKVPPDDTFPVLQGST